MTTIGDLVLPLAHATGDTWRTQAGVFEEIFLVFLVLGTAVGVVVIGYMLYNVWRYRATVADEPENPPRVGELPRGEGGGKKLFVSFGISAIIVVGLIVWTYSALLYVEQGPPEDLEENMVVEVDGYTFAWDFTYENGHTETDTLYVPEGHVVRLEVTSTDVWHTFGVTDLRVKADAIPGQVDTTWFIADEQGEYLIECFELCGAGHSYMDGEVVVLSEEEFEEWYEETEADDDDDDDTEEDE